MSSSTTPIRLDSTLFAAAAAAGARMHRSASQQLAYWARLGKALEESGSLSSREIDRALAGQISYDELGLSDQALVRAAWVEEVEERVENLDLAAALIAKGQRRFSQLGPDAEIVTTERHAVAE